MNELAKRACACYSETCPNAFFPLKDLFQMKVKNNEEEHELLPSDFTGAFERCDGVQFTDRVFITCFKNGKLHREDGPAVEWADGEKRWYLSGEHFYSEEEWKIEIEKLRENRNALVTVK
jgi:hypothetical protein